MSTHKQIDRICCGMLLMVLLLTIVFMNAGRFGVQAVFRAMGYESRLFDTTMVHTIDIEMEDWDTFLEGCMDEEYVSCSLMIDQEVYKNVAIRAKGNTSLTSVASYGNNRYSFKVEFDHYDQSNTYYGLDKLCLNNIIQDNTYMKDYVTYQMMYGFGADSPLCSFAYITVNGEDFGLYLAVEGVEESFLERNYGNDYGELYKPDSTSMGGGRGNGAGFDPGVMEEIGNPQENPDNAGKEAESSVESEQNEPLREDGDTQRGENAAEVDVENRENPFNRAPERDMEVSGATPPEGAEISGEGVPPEGMGTSGEGIPPEGMGTSREGMPLEGALPEGIGMSGEGMPSESMEAQGEERQSEAMEAQGEEMPSEGMGMPEDRGTMESDASRENINEQGNKINRSGSGMEEGKGPGGHGGMSMGSEDVALIYTDDEYDSYSNIFDNAKTEISDNDRDRLIASLKKLNDGEDIENVVDVEEVIRYFTVHNFVCNFDSYTGTLIHNYYLYEKDGQFSMIPWDYNLAFGGFGSGTDAQGMVNYPIDSPVSGGTIESRPMLAWIFADEEYTELYHQYFAEFIEQYFTNGELENMIDTVSKMIAPYVEKDPTKFCTYEEFQEGVSALKSFCALRAESIKGQLDGTISSTETTRQSISEEQQTEDSNAVETADLSIEAMGTMGKNFDQRGDLEKHLSEAADVMAEPGLAAEGKGISLEGGSESSNLHMEKPEDMDAMARMGSQPDIQGNNAGNSWILTVVSAMVLFVGIFYVCKYKRYS